LGAAAAARATLITVCLGVLAAAVLADLLQLEVLQLLDRVTLVVMQPKRGGQLTFLREQAAVVLDLLVVRVALLALVQVVTEQRHQFQDLQLLMLPAVEVAVLMMVLQQMDTLVDLVT
jgi:hypothetical protein